GEYTRSSRRAAAATKRRPNEQSGRRFHDLSGWRVASALRYALSDQNFIMSERVSVAPSLSCEPLASAQTVNCSWYAVFAGMESTGTMALKSRITAPSAV